MCSTFPSLMNCSTCDLYNKVRKISRHAHIIIQAQQIITFSKIEWIPSSSWWDLRQSKPCHSLQLLSLQSKGLSAAISSKSIKHRMLIGHISNPRSLRHTSISDVTSSPMASLYSVKMLEYFEKYSFSLFERISLETFSGSTAPSCHRANRIFCSR